MIINESFKDPKTLSDAKKAERSTYEPTEEERDVRSAILDDLELGERNMTAPRREFNDLTVVERDSTDFMAFNTYQPNNGQNAPGDFAGSWHSNAIRPVERNKAIAMAGHVAGRLGFLKVGAEGDGGNPAEDAAEVVNAQLDWLRSRWFPEEWWLHAVLQSEVSPCAIVHMEYREIKRKRKTRKENGKWNYREEVDEAQSGFCGTLVPTPELYIENFFEKDIQKQRFIIWRRLISHSQAIAKYQGQKNFEFVKKGKHLVTDPAGGWAYVIDDELKGELDEELTYWTKDGGGSRIVLVNGVVIGDADAKNPREDGLYPFAKWYFSWMRENCFYGKSTVFAVSHDANIINTLYPLLVDGAILDTMKPMKYVGTDVIGGDVIIPGLTTTLRDQNARLDPIMPPMNSASILNALGKVEASLQDTANSDAVPGSESGRTAYEIGAREQQLARELSPFMSELVGASVQLTRLVVGDVLQHATVAEISKVQGAPQALKYKTFLAESGNGQKKKRKVEYERLPDSMTSEEMMSASMDLLEREMETGTKIYRADPRRIRDLRYTFTVGEDVLRPKSDALKYRSNLETLDRAIALNSAQPGLIDLEAAARELLFSSNPATARDPDAFIGAAQAQGAPQKVPGLPADMASTLTGAAPQPSLPALPMGV